MKGYVMYEPDCQSRFEYAAKMISERCQIIMSGIVCKALEVKNLEKRIFRDPIEVYSFKIKEGSAEKRLEYVQKARDFLAFYMKRPYLYGHDLGKDPPDEVIVNKFDFLKNCKEEVEEYINVDRIRACTTKVFHAIRCCPPGKYVLIDVETAYWANEGICLAAKLRNPE